MRMPTDAEITGFGSLALIPDRGKGFQTFSELRSERIFARPRHGSRPNTRLKLSRQSAGARNSAWHCSGDMAPSLTWRAA